MIKLALIGSIIGLIILFYLSNSLMPEKINIEEAYKKQVDDWVIVEGKVKWIKNYNGLTLIKLCQNSCIFVVVFDDIKIDIDKNIEVLGKIKMYKGKKEIQAEKIEYVA